MKSDQPYDLSGNEGGPRSKLSDVLFIPGAISGFISFGFPLPIFS